MKSYELHSVKDTRLPFIFHATRMSPNHISSTDGNWHENVEILIIKEGTGVIRLNDRQHNVQSGDIIVANQNVLHKISSVGGMFYYCLIVERSFCVANHFDTNLLRFDEYLHDDEVFSLCCELADEFANKDSNDFSVQMIRAKVLLVMSLLCRRYSHTETFPQTDTHLLSCIKQAIGYIHSESSRDLSLDEVAEFVGLSKYYFAREFKRITGYTFVSYLNFVRCEEAKRLLAETRKSIGEISIDCGFSDRSYFTKVFKKYYGVIPAQMRART